MHKIHHVGIGICLTVYLNIFCTYLYYLREILLYLDAFRGLPGLFAEVQTKNAKNGEVVWLFVVLAGVNVAIYSNDQQWT